MPETMLRYRAASFFGKLYAPELLMGIASAEEMQDTIDLTPQADGSFARQEEAQAAPSMTTADIAALNPTSPSAAVDVTPAAEPEAPAAAPAEAPEQDDAAQREAQKQARQEELLSLKEDVLSAFGQDEAERLAGCGIDYWTKTDCRKLLRMAEKLDQAPSA